MASNKISFYRGDTPLVSLSYPRVGDLLTADPATYVASFTLTSDEDPLVDASTAIKYDVTPVVAGTVWTADFQLTNTDTQNLDPDTLYYYDIQLRKVDASSVTTTVSGVCVIKTDYTRRVS